MKKCIQLVILSWLLPVSLMAQHPVALDGIPVTNPDHSITKLDVPEGKTIAIVTLGSDCPISQKYIPTLESIRNSFKNDIAVIGVFPSYFTIDEVAAFQKEYDIKFRVVIDHEMKIIDLLQAKVTPEVFLLTAAPEFKRIYSGAIDNWFYDLGKYRTNVTKHYLKDAIEATRNGKTIPVKVTEAISCIIQRDKKSAKHDHMHH